MFFIFLFYLKKQYQGDHINPMENNRTVQKQQNGTKFYRYNQTRNQLFIINEVLFAVFTIYLAN